MTRHRKPATVVIAGSRALPTGIAPRVLARFLASLPDGSRVLLRRGRFSQPNLFEAQVEMVCDLFGVKVQWCQPETKDYPWPTLMPVTTGRERTFARDLQMIDWADVVLCFYDITEVGDERSGTVGLVEKALQAEKNVYAYAMNGDRLERVGEWDLGNTWGEWVPAPA